MRQISQVDIKDGARDFRIMKRAMCNAVLSLSETSRFSKGIFAWVGFHTEWISYENKKREEGISKWSLFKLFRYALDGIISFSTVPLAVASVLGILLCIWAVSMIVVLIIQKISSGIEVNGYAFLMCTILLLGGNSCAWV